MELGTAIMLGMCPDKVQVVGTEDAEERGAVAGFNVQTRGKYQMLYPRISRRHFADLQDSRSVAADDELEELLAGFAKLSVHARNKFSATRRAVWKPHVGGSKKLVLVPRIPCGTDEIDLIEGMPVEEALRGLGIRKVPRSELAQREKKRTYQLSQVFNDKFVLDKYPVSLRQIESAKRVAASDPVAAARLLQDAMNSSQTVVNVAVKAQAYDRSASQAALAIKEFTRGYESPSWSIESEVVGKYLYMFGPEGRDDWMVRGPMKHACELYSIYCLVAAEGVVLPSVLLSMECILLKIDIGNNYSLAQPELIYHVGTDDIEPIHAGMNEETAEMLSTSQRIGLESLSERLLPVNTADGRLMATAVRVSDRHVLMNTHVADADPGCTVGGVMVQPLAQLSRDVWSALCEGSGQPWVLRDPMVGEYVVLCCVGQGGTHYSPPLKVQSVEATCLMLSLDRAVRHGMSGAAVVALSDMALLGVHSAYTSVGLLAYRFGPAQFADLLMRDTVSSVSRASDEDSFGGQVVKHFEKRGIGHLFKATCESLVELRDGLDTVGMAVNYGGRLVTTCNPSERVLNIPGQAVPVTWRSSGDAGTFFGDRVPVGLQSPVFTREPSVFEKVFMVGWDGAPYVSLETRVVYVGLNAKSFVVKDCDQRKVWNGGLVVGWDGAVLGQVGHKSVATPVGLGFWCWPLPKPVVEKVADPRTVLATVFPFLNLVAWPDHIIEEIFTHTSVGEYLDGGLFNAGCRPLANIGDNAAKMELWASMREAGIPHSTWAGRMQAMQSNRNYAELAWRFKFAACLKVGLGAVIPKESKSYADLTEAVLGAAALMEEREVFKQLCQAMEIIYIPPPCGGDLDEFHRNSSSTTLNAAGGG